MIQVEILDTTIPTDRHGYAVTPVDSYYHALTTPKGSVIGLPSYGTDFRKRKHRTLNNATILDYKRNLADACAFDPRLHLEEVRLDTTQLQDGEVRFDIFLSIGVISGRLAA